MADEKTTLANEDPVTGGLGADGPDDPQVDEVSQVEDVLDAEAIEESGEAAEEGEEAAGEAGEAAEVDEQEELDDEAKQAAELKEAVQVARERIGPLRLKLTITVPRDLLDKRLAGQFEELRRDATVPGFRKGHAPIKLVEKRFGMDVAEQLAGKLIGASFMAAMEKEKIDTVGDPLIWAQVEEDRVDADGRTRTVKVDRLVGVAEALDLIPLPKVGPLVYACEVEERPVFELPPLEKIPVKRESVTITDKNVDEEMMRLQWQRAAFAPVESGAIEPNDLLYVDQKLTVDGEVVESKENEELFARSSVVGGVPLPKLGEVLVGRLRGDQVSVEGTAPDDHEKIGIRGKTVRFDFTVHEIKRLQVPPLDVEALSVLGFSSEAELRSAIKERLEARAFMLTRELMRRQVETYLVQQTAMELPEQMSLRQTQRVLQQRMIEMYRQGVPEAQITQKLDELRVSAQSEAINLLKMSFIFEKLAEKFEIEVADEEINAAISDIAASRNRRFDRVRDDLSRNNGLVVLYLNIRNRKVLDRLLVNAEVTDETGRGPAAEAGPGEAGAGPGDAAGAVDSPGPDEGPASAG